MKSLKKRIRQLEKQQIVSLPRSMVLEYDINDPDGAEKVLERAPPGRYFLIGNHRTEEEWRKALREHQDNLLRQVAEMHGG